MPNIPSQNCPEGQQITVSQAYQYAQQAGFKGDGLAIIVAIAQAESGLCTTAWNSNDPNGGSFGVLQINGAHIGSQLGQISEQCAIDPLCSFNYAYDLSQGTDFSAWGAYTNGSYLRFLTQSLSGGLQPSGGTGGGTPNQGTQPGVPLTSQAPGVLTDIPNPFDAITNSPLWQIISDPIRMLKLTFGLMLIGIAFFLLIRPEVTT